MQRKPYTRVGMTIKVLGRVPKMGFQTLCKFHKSEIKPQIQVSKEKWAF
jgi:hypothetical protein